MTMLQHICNRCVSLQWFRKCEMKMVWFIIRMLTAIGLYTNNMMKHLFGTPARDEWLRMPFFTLKNMKNASEYLEKVEFVFFLAALGAGEAIPNIFRTSYSGWAKKKNCHSFQWLQLETESIYDVKVIFNNRKMSDKLNDSYFVKRIVTYWLTAIIINN